MDGLIAESSSAGTPSPSQPPLEKVRLHVRLELNVHWHVVHDIVQGSESARAFFSLRTTIPHGQNCRMTN